MSVAILLNHSGNIGIPDIYQEVQYISFTSGAYINTNVSIQTDSIFVEIKVYESSYGNDRHYFGVDTSSGEYYHFTAFNNKYYWGTETGEKNGGAWASGDKIIKYNNASNSYEVSVNGSVIGSGNPAPTSNDTIKIGRRSNTSNFVGRVYYCKMKNNSTGKIVRNFVPVKRIADSVAGLWDKANRVFYTNNGGGSITAGPVVS